MSPQSGREITSRLPNVTTDFVEGGHYVLFAYAPEIMAALRHTPDHGGRDRACPFEAADHANRDQRTFRSIVPTLPLEVTEILWNIPTGISDLVQAAPASSAFRPHGRSCAVLAGH